MDGLLQALDGDPAVDACVDDVALVRAMLAFETALAIAVAPPDVAHQVALTCGDLDVDVADLARRSTAAGNPVVPLVADLAAAVPEPCREWVHRGATSQDVLDTALMLVAKDALDAVVASLDAAADAAATIARAHRGTLALARTLGQPATPTTFGVRAAGWCAGLDAAARRLREVREHGLAVQLGGAAGTLSAFSGNGLEVARRVAEVLGLVDPGVPWHTERSRVHALAAALASATAAAGKVATDVVLLSGAEVAEVAEGGGPGHGGSSAMPQKRNPVTSVLVVAAGRRTPGLLSSVLAAGVHEQERATGSWHAEWQPLRELLRLAGGAAARTAVLLRDLQVDTGAMAAHLDAASPGVLAERLATGLAHLGRTRAQALVADALARARDEGRELKEVLLDEPDVQGALTADQIDALLDARAALGSADEIVTRVLDRRGNP